MRRVNHIILAAMTFLVTSIMYGQSNENCFLNDFKPKIAQIPPAVDSVKPGAPATVIVTLNGDTLGKISKYVFGNAIAVWTGSIYDNQTVLNNTKLLAPTFIRFPGGSWSDIFFWNGIPSDIPDSVYNAMKYDGTTAPKEKFWPQAGKDSWPATTDQYYDFILNSNVNQGLITVNYAYARYGLSDNPVAQAAHLAADWVRYDNGRTLFWEIGNESAGAWEAGMMIDTTTNKDGQPQFITGTLYGKHFKVFVDSMKAAAAEYGNTIYIGAQVIHYDASTSTNSIDKYWNEGLFKEIGDKADFYVMHNYFSTSIKVKDILKQASAELTKNITFIKQDIINKGATPRPVALTEYNMGSGSAARGASYINGMQATILIAELIKNNFGLGARWLLVTGDGGMFYGGSDANYLYHPHPDFYYLHYLQKLYGDHAISVSSSHVDVLSYASRFSSGETGVVVVNTGTLPQVVKINTKGLGVGQKYYMYSFTGGTDAPPFSQNVYINSVGPDTYQWGPFSKLATLPANAYPIENEIKVTSPATSVQMILIEGGNNILSVNGKADSEIPQTYNLSQNYPNPFNPSTHIDYQLPSNVFVTLKVFDVLGREVETLVNDHQDAGKHSVQFNASNLPSGMYFYSIEAGAYHDTKKLLLLK